MITPLGPLVNHLSHDIITSCNTHTHTPETQSMSSAEADTLWYHSTFAIYICVYSTFRKYFMVLLNRDHISKVGQTSWTLRGPEWRLRLSGRPCVCSHHRPQRKNVHILKNESPCYCYLLRLTPENNCPIHLPITDLDKLPDIWQHLCTTIVLECFSCTIRDCLWDKAIKESPVCPALMELRLSHYQMVHAWKGWWKNYLKSSSFCGKKKRKCKPTKWWQGAGEKHQQSLSTFYINTNYFYLLTEHWKPLQI